MTDHWEMLDVYKALLAIIAGLVLGLERELKDKAAGIKTITIITLGAALFTIISYKVGGIDRGTAIAAYIVSGVGFLGAGVIFKDGFTVSGLTTAGIIWMAAAIGTSIGFGEFFMALTFLLASLLVIFVTPFINSLFVSRKQTRQFQFELNRKDIEQKESILKGISDHQIHSEVKKIELKDGRVVVSGEMILKEEEVEWLQDYFLNHPIILSFSF
jgi:putative Mg2+ transporter-C (MgtC) family protein